MKKIITGIIMAAGLLLLASCIPNTNIGTTEPTNGAVSATPTVLPTGTPEVTVTLQITATPTEEPLPTEAPTATPVPSPTLSPTPSPTLSPTPTATATPVPTEEPEPTEEPLPTVSPIPTPELNPETLVNHGWQKTISIDEKYTVIFPELFRESTVTKENNTLLVKFTCPEETAIEFKIVYMMQRTLQDVENEILSAGGTILTGSLGEKRVVLEWQEEDMVSRAVLLEEQYARTLLGGSFGEEEWITGVMMVAFTCPKEQQAAFEAEEYSYYVEQNREE